MKEYQLVAGDLLVEFNARVNKFIEEGWELYGPPTTGTWGNSNSINFCFIQAMIKNTKNTID